MSAALEAAIVRIRRGEVGIGAGFLAAPGKILTCAHVVAEALNLKGTPTEPPSAELELDFPLLRGCPVLRGRVSSECWVPIERETGRGDIACLDLLEDAPGDARPLRIIPSVDLFGHEFITFGFPAPRPGLPATRWPRLASGPTAAFSVGRRSVTFSSRARATAGFGSSRASAGRRSGISRFAVPSA